MKIKNLSLFYKIYSNKINDEIEWYTMVKRQNNHRWVPFLSFQNRYKNQLLKIKWKTSKECKSTIAYYLNGELHNPFGPAIITERSNIYYYKGKVIDVSNNKDFINFIKYMAFI